MINKRRSELSRNPLMFFSHSSKRAVAGFEVILMIVSLFAFAFIVSDATVVTAATSTSEPSACCEKTTDGAWCVNAPESECDSGYVSSSTSCETTSYCRTGTCYESDEGICMENTPQRVCNDNGGTWDAREIELVPQCQLGCCIIADQAAFVPLVRCKKLSTLFGVENDYRRGITNEVSCIAEAQAQDVGACVYEKEFERVCDFTTRGQCGAESRVSTINGTNVTLSSQKTFYEDFLCSAEELNTACAKQTSTTCYRGDVLWVDSCGNRENVYSDDKVKSWNAGKVLDADAICDPNDGSDMNCGNCEYLLGSRCAEYDSFIGGPKDGDNYCQKTECVDREGKKRINGESWCVYDDNIGNGADLVGSRDFREVCIDGDVVVEPCADFRNEVCLDGSIETSAGEFQTAACRVNRWQECLAQEEEDDCINIDKRDCIWTKAVTGMVIGGSGQTGGTFSNPSASRTFTNPTATGGISGNVVAPITGNFLFGGGSDDDETESTTKTNRPDGVCIPNFPPGLKFWEESSAQATCGQANAKCVVVYEEGLLGGKECVSGCECEKSEWALDANRICVGLGDCGGYSNYLGTYTDDGYKWVEDGKDKEFSPNTVNIIKGGFTGMVVAAITGNVAGGSDLVTRIVSGTRNSPGNGYLQLGEDTAGKTIIGGTSSYAINPTATVAAKGVSSSALQALEASRTTYTAAIDTYASSGTGQKLMADVVAAQTAVTKANAALDVAQMPDSGITAEKLATARDTLTGAQTNLANAETAFADGAAQDAAVQSTSQAYTQALANAQPGSSFTSRLFNLEFGGAADALVSGLQWAAIAYVAGMMIGPMIGLSEKNTEALSTSLAAGFGAYKTVSVINAGEAAGVNSWATFGGINPALTGLVVGVVIFALMYKEETIKIIEFNCMPWQAPTGGNACEECNDADLPCSEYRCKSLGQNCELVNEGSDQEKCVNVNPRDVNPPVIKPNYEVLSTGHEYTNVKNSPPGPGFSIVNTLASDGCLKAFTPLEFGITVDEPAQCKIDFNHTTSFDDMLMYVGGNNLFSYNHSEKFSLPSAAAIKNSSLILENGKDLTFFIRCKDKNGNENEAEYAVKFCVDPTPDTTAPTVEATSINNGGCVAENQDSAEVRFYTNEPASCRWSPQDQDYDNMQGTMTCSNQIYQANAAQLFTCVADLTGIARDLTNFYVRCKDYAGDSENDRNEMSQSYKFSLRGSTGLKMKNLRPNETIFGAVNPSPVELYVETLFGCNDGQAICGYSETGNSGDYIQFFDTNTEDGIHTQRLDLTAGNQKYYVKCVDEGGNLVEDVAEFTLDIDTSAPVVARLYEENELLKIVTVRNSECAYTFDNCDFTFDEGTEMPYANSTTHVTEWNQEKTYYIKCRDEFRNEDADCSVVVRPTRDLFR